MRNTRAIAMLFLSLIIVGTATLASAQTNRQTTNRRQTSVLKQQQPRQPATLSDRAVAAAQQAAQQTETQINNQIKAIELQVQREEQALNQQLARANQLRAQALKTENGQLLKQAEEIERKAIDNYQRRINYYEQLSERTAKGEALRIPNSTAAPAARPAARPNGQWNAKQPTPRPAPKKTSPSTNNSVPRRGWFGFGR